jgi:hypothetical protein
MREENASFVCLIKGYRQVHSCNFPLLAWISNFGLPVLFLIETMKIYSLIKRLKLPGQAIRPAKDR